MLTYKLKAAEVTIMDGMDPSEQPNIGQICADVSAYLFSVHIEQMEMQIPPEEFPEGPYHLTFSQTVKPMMQTRMVIETATGNGFHFTLMAG